MQKYIGVKKVEAEPMTRGDYNSFKGWTIPDNENPDDEGYLVKYSDDYISWSPKKQFEEAYREVGVNPLHDTALPMISESYKERFIAEYVQLVVRYKKLSAMLLKWSLDKLDFEPTCPKGIYNFQIKAMGDYIACLEIRAVIEGIKLPKNIEV